MLNIKKFEKFAISLTVVFGIKNKCPNIFMT